MSREYVELNTFMAVLALFRSQEAAINEAVRQIKERKRDWIPILRPLLGFAGEYWRDHMDEIRIALQVTPADEKMLNRLPLDEGFTSIIAAGNMLSWVDIDNPDGRLMLSLALRIAWHYSSTLEN